MNGRRKVMLFACDWFSIGMGFTAFTTSTTLFGLMRFATGLGWARWWPPLSRAWPSTRPEARRTPRITGVRP